MSVTSLALPDWMMTFGEAASCSSCLGLQLGEFCVRSRLNGELSCEMSSRGFRGDQIFRPPSLNECNAEVFALPCPVPLAQDCIGINRI